MPTQSGDPGTGDRGPGDLGAQLVRHLDTVRCFVRIQLSPALRQREQESDIVQSVCAEVLAHPDRFQWQGEAAFRSWLYRAVLDRVRQKLRFHRSDRRDMGREEPPGSGSDGVLDSYAEMVTPSRIAMSRELQRELELAIDELPEPQREVLVRARLLQMEHEAIASDLGITVVHSRQLLHRALAKLALVVQKGK